MSKQILVENGKIVYKNGKIVVVENGMVCPCCGIWVLEDCLEVEEPIYTYVDLSAYEDDVIQITSGDTCWKVRKWEESDGTDFIITSVSFLETFGDCPSCLNLFVLEDCEGLLDDIVTTTNLSEHLENIVKIADSDTCWIVRAWGEEGDVFNPALIMEVSVTDSFSACPECLEWKVLEECPPGDSIIVTDSDLSPYEGRVIKISGSDKCWTFRDWEIDDSTVALDVTVVDDFDDCEECEGPFFVLTDCHDPENIKITDTDLTAYLGLVIKISGSDTCWTVSEKTTEEGESEDVTYVSTVTDGCLNEEECPDDAGECLKCHDCCFHSNSTLEVTLPTLAAVGTPHPAVAAFISWVNSITEIPKGVGDCDWKVSTDLGEFTDCDSDSFNTQYKAALLVSLSKSSGEYLWSVDLFLEYWVEDDSFPGGGFWQNAENCLSPQGWRVAPEDEPTCCGGSRTPDNDEPWMPLESDPLTGSWIMRSYGPLTITVTNNPCCHNCLTGECEEGTGECTNASNGLNWCTPVECPEGLSETYVVKAGLTSMGAYYNGNSTDISDLYWYGEMELLKDITLTRIGETCVWGYENSDPESNPDEVQTKIWPTWGWAVGKVISATLRLVGCKWELYIMDSGGDTDLLTMPLLRTVTTDPSGSWQESKTVYDPMFDETHVRSYSGTVEDSGGP